MLARILGGFWDNPRNNLKHRWLDVDMAFKNPPDYVGYCWLKGLAHCCIFPLVQKQVFINMHL
jgi:hypothetical protein